MFNQYRLRVFRDVHRCFETKILGLKICAFLRLEKISTRLRFKTFRKVLCFYCVDKHFLCRNVPEKVCQIQVYFLEQKRENTLKSFYLGRKNSFVLLIFYWWESTIVFIKTTVYSLSEWRKVDTSSKSKQLQLQTHK